MKNNIKRVFLVMLIALGIMFIDSKVEAISCKYSTNDKSIGDIIVEVDASKNIKYYPSNQNYKGKVIISGAFRDTMLEATTCPSATTEVGTQDGTPYVKLIADTIVCNENPYVTQQFETMLTNLKKDFDAEINKLKADDYAYFKRYTDADIETQDRGELAHRMETIRSKYVREITATANQAGCQLSSDMLAQIESLRISKQNELYEAIRNGIKRMKDNGYLQELVDNGEITEKEAENLEAMTEAAISEAKRKYEPIYDYDNSQLIEIESGDLSCESLLDQSLVDVINKILNWLRILVPILVIALGTVDFSKAVLNEEKDELKQAFVRFVKRLIIAIVIFFVPTIMKILVDTYNSVTNGIPLTPLSDCKIK